MAANCFIAINIISKNLDVNNILNPGGIPIIFYWDGVSDIIDDIISNDNFNDIINTYILNPNQYDKSFINMIYINDTENDTYNTSKRIPIQDLYKLNDSHEFYLSYLKTSILNLYKRIFKEEYKFDDDIENIDIKNDINKIFNKIKEENPDILDNTIFYYILNDINENTKLNFENKRFLINKLKEIVKKS